MISEPAQKCENNSSFKLIDTLELFIPFKMAYSCCFSFGGNLDFPEFLQKKFYNINYCSRNTLNLPPSLTFPDLHAHSMELF